MFWFKKKKDTKKSKVKKEKVDKEKVKKEKVNRSKLDKEKVDKKPSKTPKNIKLKTDTDINKSKKIKLLPKLLDKEKKKSPSKELKKEDPLIPSVNKWNIETLAKKLQISLYEETSLSGSSRRQFETLYKMIYYLSSKSVPPDWAKYYDLLFINQGQAIIISKDKFDVGPLLTVKEIIKPKLSIDYLREIFLRIEILINQMIKFYNNGRNYNYSIIDSVKDLKLLGLASGLMYKKLCLISEVKMKLNKAEHIDQIKVLNSNDQPQRLSEISTEFKFLLSEVYVYISSIYVKTQEPYLKRFYFLWEDKILTKIGKFNKFYDI